MKATMREGIPRGQFGAGACCRSLVTVTIDHTIIEVRALREPGTLAAKRRRDSRVALNFPMTIRWILASVGTEAAG